jgi:DNA uptake protein ComE-like DNA-binding protein
LDANTAEEFELRTVRGIGHSIASDIDKKRKERPFEDEKDLYDRVKRIPPEAKTKIEVVKNIVRNYNMNRTNL